MRRASASERSARRETNAARFEGRTQRTPRDEPQRTPRDEPQRTPRDEPQRTPRDEPQRTPRDEPQRTPRDEPQRTPRDEPQHASKGEPQPTSRDERSTRRGANAAHVERRTQHASARRRRPLLQGAPPIRSTGEPLMIQHGRMASRPRTWASRIEQESWMCEKRPRRGRSSVMRAETRPTEEAMTPARTRTGPSRPTQEPAPDRREQR